MKLELNKNHKTANIQILEDTKRKIKISILGAIMAASIFSGSASIDTAYALANDNSYETEEIDDSQYSIPACFEEEICNKCNKNSISDVTSSDINSIKSLNLEINDSESLEFLSNFSNLNELCLEFFNTNDEYCLDTIPNIPSLKKNKNYC